MLCVILLRFKCLVFKRKKNSCCQTKSSFQPLLSLGFLPLLPSTRVRLSLFFSWCSGVTEEKEEEEKRERERKEREREEAFSHG